MKIIIYSCITLVLMHTSCQQSYPVKLTGGSDVYQGQIEVLFCRSGSSCEWRTVCTSGWTNTEAVVVCRQLGLFDSSTVPTNYSNSGHSGSIAMSIECTNSTFSSLWECSVTSILCTSTSRATVRCDVRSFPSYDPGMILLLSVAFPLDQPSLESQLTTSTSAIIQWSITSGRNATYYFVHCSNGYQNHVQQSDSITLTDLAPYSMYRCCVSGVDSNKVIGLQNCISFQTLQGMPQIAPIGLRYTALRSRSVTLEWEQLPAAERGGLHNTYSVNVQGCRGSEQIATNTYKTIESLCPYSVYNISVRACVTTEMCGRYSPRIIVKTLEDAPSTVNNLACHPLSATQVYIAWQQPSYPNGEIRHYEVSLLNINTTQSVTKFVNGRETSVSLNNLHPNHQYSCSVAAHSVARGSVITAPQFISLPPSSPTGPPEQLSCTAHGMTSLQMDWRQPNMLEQNGPLEYYLVIVWNVDTNEIAYTNSTSFSAQVALQVPSLLPYHNYKCVVAAYGEYGLGPFGITPVWIPETEQLGPPLNLQYTQLTSNSVIFMWNQPRVKNNMDIEIGNYSIRLFNSETNAWIVSTHQVTAQYQVRNLHPNYHYKIEVSAIARHNVTGPESIYYVKTSEEAPSGAPQNLSASEVSRSSFKLSWSEPLFELQNGEITGYSIKVATKNNLHEPMHIETTTLIALVTSAKENTMYSVSVAAMTRVGTGPFSEPISITTESALVIILCSIFGLVLLALMFVVTVVLSFYTYKAKKSTVCSLWKKSRNEMDQMNDPISVSNTIPLESSSHEHSIIEMLSKKKVKPPAIPPKTYREPEIEQNTTICPSDDDASVQSINDDVNSVGSDSLYDMKLEVANETIKLPKRSMDKKPVQGINDDISSVGSDSLYDMKLEVETKLPKRNTDKKPAQTGVMKPTLQECDAKVTIVKSITKEKVIDCTQDGDDVDYQKLDIKIINPPSNYESLHSLRNKERVTKMDSGRHSPI